MATRDRNILPLTEATFSRPGSVYDHTIVIVIIFPPVFKIALG